MELRGQWKPLKDLPKRPMTLFIDLHSVLSRLSKKASLVSTPDRNGVGYYEVLYFETDMVFAIVAIKGETNEIVVSMPLPPDISTRLPEISPSSWGYELECWEYFDAIASGLNSLTHLWESSTLKTREEMLKISKIARNWRRSLRCAVCSDVIPLDEIESVDEGEYDLFGTRLRVGTDGGAVVRPPGIQCSSCVSRAWKGLDSFKDLELWALSPDDAEVFRSYGIPASFLRDVAAEKGEGFRFSSFDADEISKLFKLGVKPSLITQWLETSVPFKLVEAILGERSAAAPLRDYDDEWLLPSERSHERRDWERRFEDAHGPEDWPAVARDLVRRGVRFSTLADWLSTGLDATAVVKFCSLGLSPEDFGSMYGDWTDWNLDSEDYMAWVSSVVSAAKRLPEDVLELDDSLPVDYGTWCEVGITDPGEALAWIQAGFSPSLVTKDGVDPYVQVGLTVEGASAIRNAWSRRLPRDWDPDPLELGDHLSALEEEIGNSEVGDLSDWLVLPTDLIKPTRVRGVHPAAVVRLLQSFSSDTMNLAGERYPDWSVIKQTVRAVLEVGLPPSVENVSTWYGCDGKEILRAIDSGLTSSLMKLVKQGLSQTQVNAYEELVRGGLDNAQAMAAIRDGFELQFLELWGSEGLGGAVRYFRNAHSEVGSGTPIAEIFAWWKEGFSVSTFHPDDRLGLSDIWRSAGFTPSDARTWAKAGLGPSDALSWRRSGFTPRTAKPWIDSAIPSDRAKAWKKMGIAPEVALRRERAGLNP
jgi:hypothetical protein